jgi:hypothetical protein
MRCAWLAVAAIGCSSPPAPPRELGMNDISILLPLPADATTPVLAPFAPMVDASSFAGVVLRGDLGSRTGDSTIELGQFQIVALRFDVCDRSSVGPCPANVDGRLRLIVQPVIAGANGPTTIDVASHVFYPIPAADLPDVVDQLRDLAALGDTPESDPLEVTPAAANPAYIAKLAALVTKYAVPANNVRITAAGQVVDTTPFEWHFRELDWDGSQFAPTLIPEVDEYQQQMQVADGDITYQVPSLGVADAPVGFALAIEGSYFKAASPANQALALDALSQILNPTLNDAVNTQCMSCHVATYLASYRAGELGVDPSASPSWYHSSRNISAPFANSDARQVRAFGYVDATPVVSQRVVNDTAHTLDDVDARYPAR